MKTHTRAVVIGGGVVGVSVLYHLAKLGWSDVVLVERSELTSGSTWHAAGGMHTINGDTNMSYLQSYTVKIYEELERESGLSCGIHRVGCLYVAANEQCYDYFKMERARARHLGLDLEFVSMDEVKKINPLIETKHFISALFDPNDGHVDPSSVTNAYAKAARNKGAEIYRNTPVIELKPTPSGGWLVVTSQGTIETEVVINAAGLWGREVGALVGLNLPIMPMEHMYVVTNEIPEVAALGQEIPMSIDFDGESYLRQEGKGLLIGTYENAAKHWSVDGTPQSFGHELLENDLDRITDAMAVAMERYPCLVEGGIKRIINGPMIFAPDGNPIIGPVRGLRNYFVATGVMAGFSQAGGVGLAVAQWVIDGEPGMDVFAMDVARFGDHVNKSYVLEKTMENYRRRFTITCPNEELPAARPLKTSPVYDKLRAEGAVFGAANGWEYPLWFAPKGVDPVEKPSFRRSNAFPHVAAECKAVREQVGLFETSSYAKFEVTGNGASAFLDKLMTNKLPSKDGRAGLCPMLTPKGQVLGDLTVTRLSPERYLLIGSPTATEYYMRWFQSHLPADDSVAVRDVTADWMGFSLTGPKTREVLSQLTTEDLSHAAFPFLAARQMTVGLAKALVIRVSFTGELGFEIYCEPKFQRHILDRLCAAGAAHGLRLCGVRALNSLRLEKGYGSWGREFSIDYNAAEAGIEKLTKLDKGEFIGRDAAAVAFKAGAKRKLAIMAVDVAETDPIGNEPVLQNGKVIGRLTSAGYGHTVGTAIALSYLPVELAKPGSKVEIEVLGEMRPATILAEPPYDPSGARMRA
ncbi:FAD-dependent oxidoreductase [Dongia soli]|uniref:FAD-dependent oxidoreductase n=1 Tax=Dongia soli TaxID=600628 RepID=A0ABU5EFE4_9PROT|nr:FAD-dependent oxidoreductase [Dongia soli]MDY0884178.1 FAD-dependent oxidoreductase [Dongia soli]